MNIGTKVRTVLVIASCFNTALMATDIAQFHNPTLDLIYRVLSVVANFIIVFCATWFNNDYTEEAARATGLMRLEKASRTMDDMVGENFFDEFEADGEEDGEDNEL